MEIENKELFESMPISEAVLRLAVPSVIGQIILVVYNIADTFFVSMTGSDAKLTAVTVCMPAFMFLSAAANLFGIGGASVMSRYLGNHNENDAHRASAYSIWGCIVVVAIYGAAALALLSQYVNILGGTNPAVHVDAEKYLLYTVIIGGVPTALSSTMSHLMRAEGRSFRAGFGIALGGILNIVLDPLFMFKIMPPGNEVIGAAIATMTSNIIAFVYFCILFFILKKNKQTLISVNPVRIYENKSIKREVLASGWPAAIMTFCENVSYAVLDKLISSGGMAMQAGVGVAKKINMLAHCIVRGMSQGVLPLIGYNYASHNYRRMKKAFSVSATMSVVMATLCMIICFIFARPLIGVFIEIASESHMYGEQFLKILCVGAPFSAFAYAVISFFQATGKGRHSRRLALLRKGALDIPLMFVLAYAISAESVVFATPIADIVCCITSIFMFKQFFNRINKREENSLREVKRNHGY